MKVIILVFAIVACAVAAPPLAHYETRHSSEYESHGHNNEASRNAKIVRFDNQVGFGNEGYKYQFETSDGIAKEEQAVFENPGTKEESLSVRGRYLYPGGPDGKFILLEYLADKNGFQPIGDHLPKPVQPLQ